MQQHGVTYMQHKFVSKGDRVRFFLLLLLSFFKNILSENIFFAKNYQENTTVCLLQPKVLGRNYLCTNNRYIVFIIFVTLTHLSLASLLWDIGKQYSPRCDAKERGVPSGAILFAWRNFIQK